MSKTRDERIMEYNAVLAVKPEAEKILLKIPGVARISVGVKSSSGKPTEHTCFRVYVDRKKGIDEISVADLVPSEIYGVKTDVNEIEKEISFSGEDMSKYRPMSGGARIITAEGKSLNGTLGCFAVDDTTKDVVMLTCYHVLMIGGEKAGHKVGQPKFRCDDCCCRCGEVARVVKGFWDDHNVDCAVAKLTNGYEKKWTNEVLQLGAISCIALNANKDPVDPFTGLTTDPANNPYRPVNVHDRVFKRGMNTRRTEGVVMDITYHLEFDFTHNNATSHKLFVNQIRIEPLSPAEPFSGKGDSGSVVLNELNQVIGLFFADNDRDINGTHVNATVSFANPIQDVVKILGITIPNTGTADTMPSGAVMLNEVSTDEDQFDKMLHVIRQLPHGDMLIPLFEKHAKEVLQLINNNREVKSVWNRCHGPAFMVHLFEKLRDAAYEVPEAIEGISHTQLFTKISTALEKKASPAMKEDIEQYSSKIFIMIGNLVRSISM